MRKPTNPHINGPGSNADPQLRAETFEVANRLRSTLLLQRETRRWQFAIIGSVTWFVLSLLVIGQPQFTAVGILGIIAYVLYLNWKDTKTTHRFRGCCPKDRGKRTYSQTSIINDRTAQRQLTGFSSNPTRQ